MDNIPLVITSFNCAGVASKLPIIHDLCSSNDIILLQETWLTPANINVLNDVHSEYESHSVTAVNFETTLIGRPYGGLSILWRKTLGAKVSVKCYDDTRILGILMETGSRKFC